MLLFALLEVPTIAEAQRTNHFRPDTTGAAGLVRTTTFSAEVENFAVLLADPSLTQAFRPSAWTATIVGSADGSEAKIQLNLCDALGMVCDRRPLAFDALLAGPLNKKDKFTDLAGFDGLAGDTRFELGGRWNILNASGAPSLALRGGFSRPSFTYRTSTGAPNIQQKQSQFQLTAALGAKWTRALVSADFRYVSGYQAQKTRSICSPVSGAPAGTVECSAVVVGSPTPVTRRIVEAEARVLSPVSVVAVGVTGQYDQADDEWGVAIPFWVIPNPKGGPGAGARITYDSSSDWRITFFVGTFTLER